GVARDLDHQPQVHVAGLATLGVRRATAAQPEPLAALAARRHLELHAALQRRHGAGGSPHRLWDPDRPLHDEAPAFALEEGMRPDAHYEVEVSRLAAVVAGAALSRDPHARTVADAGRNLDVQALTRLDRAGAAARRAGPPSDTSRPLARGARRGAPHGDRRL